MSHAQYVGICDRIPRQHCFQDPTGVTPFISYVTQMCDTFEADAKVKKQFLLVSTRPVLPESLKKKKPNFRKPQ